MYIYSLVLSLLHWPYLTNPSLPPTDPEAKDVVWHNNSRERCANYRFNTKQKDQMFCPKCGASLGIDFRETMTPRRYGISVSFFFFFFFFLYSYYLSTNTNSKKHYSSPSTSPIH
jgi:hypothetical protein